MFTNQEILKDDEHRPWSMPSQLWSFYQEWNTTLFLHWKVSPDQLSEFVPPSLTIDTHGGDAWVSIVLFAMNNIRPRMLPAVSAVSDFFEINVRTYVSYDGKPGVYFLSIEANKWISVWIARLLSGLPYEKSSITRERSDDYISYISQHAKKNFSIQAEATIGDEVHPTDLDLFLTEHYGLYLDRGQNLVRFDIHHKPWPLYAAQMDRLKINYPIGINLALNSSPDISHYSPGVQVLAWSREKI